MTEKRTVLAKDLSRLKEFIVEKAQFCVHVASGTFEDRFVTPTYGIAPGNDDESFVPERSLTGHYLQMYDWDACFFSQGAPRAGLEDLAGSVVTSFLSFRSSDGYVPRTVSPNRVWDRGDICKPLLSQALLYEWQLSEDKRAPAHEWLEGIRGYLEYLQRTRSSSEGLYAWRNVLESGVDNNLALLAPCEAAKDENKSVGDFPDNLLIACDLNGYLVTEFKAFGELSRIAGNEIVASQYERLAGQLASTLEDRLWNGELGLYCNLDPRSGEHVAIRSWTGLVPVLFGVSRPERTEEVIERNLLCDEHFLRPAGLSSTAASEPLYNQAKRGLYGRVIVSNWQGPMWILPNALAVRCLVSHDYQDQAREIARRVLSTMVRALDEKGTLFENYDAETGEPLWAPNFMSWNILALELIELMG